MHIRFGKTPIFQGGAIIFVGSVFVDSSFWLIKKLKTSILMITK
jgi:hypothetical protein